MKNISIYQILASAACMSLFIGCTDLVNEEKDSIVRSSEGGGFTAGNPTELLASAYKDLGTYTDQAGIYALGMHTSAEMIPPTRGVDWGDNGVWRTLDSHTWDASHTYIRDAWNNLNQRAYKANEIIASNPTPAQKAEAQFLRAFNMFHVMDYWGVTPFREVTQGADELPRVLTRSEAFDFIVKDLEEALPNLANIGPGANNGVASKAAANFLLAKLYLNKAIYKSNLGEVSYTFDNADMAKVEQYVDAIEANGYSLESSYFKNFTSNASNEIIFVSLEGTPQNRWMMTLHYDQDPSGWNGFTTLADFYDTFEDTDIRKGLPPVEDGTEFSWLGKGFLIGQQRGPVKDSKGEYVTDADGKILIEDIIDSRSNKPLMFSRDVPLAGAATEKGIRVIKYHPADAGKYVLMRFGEAYMMKAEALFRSGNTAGALEMINDLRTQNKASALASLTADNLFEEIGRELYWEGGKRTIEIRFGKFVNGEGATVNDPHTVLYPIPSTAIVSNPNLNQNPGY
ncbi:putative outer membrane starch-binding protein [Dyadobacter jejuensis]|uniref:Putative outer membrane starch-binding protein n=1 Tax=Dyadobacter jejuensis TaxID=1082580 RepID=A0A316ARU6_9BACT|nr:RagB/SusD family nutrient uptake outer membrane protein [Dyadobacter jejuensis]PWJ60415.1 putative outer membrane starch-binding protein [Dyadobacter jejuensis]